MEKSEIYDRDFKVNVAILAIEKGVSKTAKEIALPAGIIYKWRDRYRKFGSDGFCGGGQFRNPEQKRLVVLKITLTKRLQKVERQIEIFKSASKYILQGKPMIFYFIENNLDKYSVCGMCEVLGIRETTYYRWRDKILSPRQLQTTLINKEITSIFYENKERYGNYRISAELQSRGFKLKPCTVNGYMKKLRLTSKLCNRRKIQSSAPFIQHNPYIFPNVLNRQFKVDEPSKVWVAGITSIEIESGLIFLTIIMDLFDRKVIGYCLSDRLTIEQTTIPAWEMAVLNRKPKKGLIFHSDRSPQYANKMFTCKLNSYKHIRRSMSRKENHLDNAMSKRFFIALKSELASLNKLPIKKEIEEKIPEYLEQTSKVFKYKLL